MRLIPSLFSYMWESASCMLDATCRRTTGVGLVWVVDGEEVEFHPSRIDAEDARDGDA